MRRWKCVFKGAERHLFPPNANYSTFPRLGRYEPWITRSRRRRILWHFSALFGADHLSSWYISFFSVYFYLMFVYAPFLLFWTNTCHDTGQISSVLRRPQKKGIENQTNMRESPITSSLARLRTRETVHQWSPAIIDCTASGLGEQGIEKKLMLQNIQKLSREILITPSMILLQCDCPYLTYPKAWYSRILMRYFYLLLGTGWDVVLVQWPVKTITSPKFLEWCTAQVSYTRLR